MSSPADGIDPSEATRHWNRVLAPYSQADNGKAVRQLGLTVVLFAALW